MYLQVAFLIKTFLMLRHLSVHSSLKKSGIFFIIKESLNRKIIEKVICNYTVCAICCEKFLWENELQVCKCKKCWHRFHLFGEFHLERTLNLGWDFQRSLERLGGGFRENWVSDSLIVLWKLHYLEERGWKIYHPKLFCSKLCKITVGCKYSPGFLKMSPGLMNVWQRQACSE